MIQFSVTPKFFVVLGSLNAAIVVVLGAFGAHVLEIRLSAEMIDIYRTAVQYHMYHALGLFAVSMVASLNPGSVLFKFAGWAMLGGIFLFSGSLYALSFSGIRWLGAITPVGGSLFLVSWLILALGALKNKKKGAKY